MICLLFYFAFIENVYFNITMKCANEYENNYFYIFYEEFILLFMYIIGGIYDYMTTLKN